jgi:Tfp pilus assembly protein PilN
MMRTTLNLSRRPFANRRLLWIAIASVFFISLWLFLWITSERNLVSAKADRINLNIKDLQGQVEAAKQERERRSREQKPPEVTDQDRIELASARQLLERKSFSWNRVIAEIERYVPKNARVFGLKVDEIANLGQDDVASIEIKMIGQTSAQMTEMMEMLEKSGGLFAIRQSSQDAPDDSGEVPFTLNLIYSPSRGAAQ